MSDLERIEQLAARVPTEDGADWTDDQIAEDTERQAWRIGSKSEAAWAMEKLAGLAGQQAENDRVAADRIDAVQAWQKRENTKLQGSVDYFAGQLRIWHMAQVTADPNDEEAWKKEKFKTINLPDGVVSVRKGGLSAVIEDEFAFEEFVDLHPDVEEIEGLIERKAVPIKAAIKKYIEETGESLPGVKVERSEPKFEVKPAVVR